MCSSTRGPAIAPSFGTCPTRKTDTPPRGRGAGGLPDPRVAAEKGRRGGAHAAPHHPVELRDPARRAQRGGLRDLREAHRAGGGEVGHAGALPRRGRGGDLLDQRVPLPASRAFPHPLRRGGPARRARELDLYLRHAFPTSRATSSNVAAPDRTIRFTSSYSGTGRTEPSGSVASFTRTRPNRVPSARDARSSFIRSHAWNRRPIAVETEKTAEETISSRSSGHRRGSTQPRRVFFFV